MQISTQEFKNIGSKLKGLYKINPVFHWKLLLVFMGVGFLVFTFYGLLIFFKVKNQTLFKEQEVQSQTQVTIKSKLLKNINESFDKKSVKTKSILENKYLYADPSL